MKPLTRNTKPSTKDTKVVTSEQAKRQVAQCCAKTARTVAGCHD